MPMDYMNFKQLFVAMPFALFFSAIERQTRRRPSTKRQSYA